MYDRISHKSRLPTQKINSKFGSQTILQKVICCPLNLCELTCDNNNYTMLSDEHQMRGKNSPPNRTFRDFTCATPSIIRPLESSEVREVIKLNSIQKQLTLPISIRLRFNNYALKQPKPSPPLSRNHCPGQRH